MVEAKEQEWQPLPNSQAAGLVAQMAQAFARRDAMEEIPEYRGFCASLANDSELLYVFRTLIDAESAPKVEPRPGFADRIKGFIAGYMRGLEDRE